MKSHRRFFAVFSLSVILSSSLAQSVVHPRRPPPPASAVTSCLSLCLHQGAEAQNNTATQRAQVPDTRLHRVSEAEDCLLWPQVTTEGESERGREGVERGRVHASCLTRKKKANLDTLILRSGLLRLLPGLLPESGRPLI